MPAHDPAAGAFFSRDLDQLTNAAAYARFGVQRQLRYIKHKVARANQFRMATRLFRCPSNAALAAWFGAFEEPPRMSSDTCRRKADEAKHRAAQASEPSVKSAYEKVAEHWMLLARLDSLIHDETITKPPSKAGP
jgi:hypothetical protein